MFKQEGYCKHLDSVCSAVRLGQKSDNVGMCKLEGYCKHLVLLLD